MNSEYISKKEIYDCLDKLESITGTSREWEDRDQVFVSAVKATAKAVRAVVGLAKEQDVAPVVRCIECKYNEHCFTQSFVRDESVIPFDPNTWFCADGKRTDGDGDGV